MITFFLLSAISLGSEVSVGRQSSRMCVRVQLLDVFAKYLKMEMNRNWILFVLIKVLPTLTQHGKYYGQYVFLSMVFQLVIYVTIVIKLPKSANNNLYFASIVPLGSEALLPTIFPQQSLMRMLPIRIFMGFSNFTCGFWFTLHIYGVF